MEDCQMLLIFQDPKVVDVRFQKEVIEGGVPLEIEVSEEGMTVIIDDLTHLQILLDFTVPKDEVWCITFMVEGQQTASGVAHRGGPYTLPIDVRGLAKDDPVINVKLTIARCPAKAGIRLHNAREYEFLLIRP